jgi:hypothetical protein
VRHSACFRVPPILVICRCLLLHERSWKPKEFSTRIGWQPGLFAPAPIPFCKPPKNQTLRRRYKSGQSSFSILVSQLGARDFHSDRGLFPPWIMLSCLRKISLSLLCPHGLYLRLNLSKRWNVFRSAWTSKRSTFKSYLQHRSTWSKYSPFWSMPFWCRIIAISSEARDGQQRILRNESSE